MQTQHVETEFKPDFGFSKVDSKVVQRVWTRWEHGSIPVLVWETETRGLVYELEREDGSEFYRSASRLLRAVTGRTKPATFDRYFKIDEGRELETRPNVIKVLDNHRRKVTVPAIQGELRRTDIAHAPVETQNSVEQTQFPAANFEFRPTHDGLKLTEGADETLVRNLVATFEATAAMFAGDEPVLGVDLVNRSHEVRKLLFKSYRGHMLVKNYDPDDVLQEIYKGLITRNNGTCPWDGRKSTFGYYVTMVIGCILTNYHRKMQRRQDREHAELEDGMLAPGATWSESSDNLARESLEAWLSKPEHGGDTPDGLLAIRIVPFVSAGMQRREIVDATGERETQVSRALHHLRKWSKLWADEIGVHVKERKRRKKSEPSAVMH